MLGRLILYTLALALAYLGFLVANPQVDLQLLPVPGEPHAYWMHVENRGLLPILVVGWPTTRGPGFETNGSGCGNGMFCKRLMPRTGTNAYQLTPDWWVPSPGTREVGLHYLLPSDRVFRREPLESRIVWVELPPDFMAAIHRASGSE